MRAEKQPRILMAKPGLDGHWRGAMAVSLALRDAGLEVIYIGNQTPNEIAEVAIQEDVDIVGLSILAASHMELLPEVLQQLNERAAYDIPVVVGGIIPPEDIGKLKEAGIAEVFPPGSKLQDIVSYISELAAKKRSIR